MQQAKITSIFLFLEGYAKANIQYPDSTNVEIQIPREALEGKTMDERYALITARAKKYVSCLEVEDMTSPDYRSFVEIKEIYSPLGQVE